MTRTGNLYQITVVPRTNLSGSAVITVSARDPLGSATTNQIRVVIRSVSEMPTGLPQRRASALEPADFGGDGAIDLFFSGWIALSPSSGRGWSALFRNVTGGFHEMDPGNLSGGDERAQWGDADGDGDLDLVAHSTLYLNQNSTFSGIIALGTDAMAAPAWGDFDADGDLDLVLAGGRTRAIKLFENNGEDLAQRDSPMIAVLDGSVAWGDPDNDGDLDLAISGAEVDSFQAVGTLRIYQNDTGGWRERFKAIGVRNGVLQWADANGDGRAELLMAGTSPLRERLFINQGNFVFAERDVGPNTNGVTALPGALLVDFDSDGDADLAEYSIGSFGIRANDGSGMFATRWMASANTLALILKAADFDGDGDYDILTGGRSSISSFTATAKIHRNHWIPQDAGVNELSAQTTENGVRLNWPVRRDFSAPPTYNLRVGRTPGGGDIVSPLSRADGKRLVAADGNMGFANATSLRDLETGRYYWSIQPIDAAWNGGAFSLENTFVIGAQPYIESVRHTSGLEIVVAAKLSSFLTLQTSRDLRGWTSLASGTSDESGRLKFDLSPTGSPAFFRIQVRP